MILRVLSVSVCALFAVSSANAQCVGCAGSTPAFGHAIATPVQGYAVQGYAINTQPVYSHAMNNGCGCASNPVGMTYTSAPVVSQPVGCQGCQGCVGCGQAHVSPQMTYTSAPVQSGCAGCGSAAVTYASAPVQSGCGCGSAVGTYTSAPVQSGCAGCGNAVPVNTGCGCASTGCASAGWHGSVSPCAAAVPTQGCGQQCCNVQPQRSFRVNVLGGRRSNCCY